MSEYTTGELAKMNHISVRTLQYYDKKGLLTPNKIDNNKRIYGDEDLKQLKLILLLKSMGLKLAAIKDILISDDSLSILELMLTEQERVIKAELNDNQEQLALIETVKKNLPDPEVLSAKSITDISELMTNKQALKKVHRNMILYGIPINIVEYGTLAYSIITGNWLPFIIAIVAVIIGATLISKYYFQQTNYICPNCQTEFKPKFSKAFWAPHNIRARKLTCPACQQTNYCVEVYDEQRNKNKNTTNH